MSYFSDHSNVVNFKALGGEPNSGFRPGQLGALHAIVAHFSVHEEPAIVSLPTGYGKTAVIMALPFILSAKRLLIVEPTDVLRRQTAAHMSVLSTLSRLNVIPQKQLPPSVHGQVGRPGSGQAWEALRKFDVVVSTPASTSPKSELPGPSDMFDLIVLDEAHHAPADTWAAYLEHYKDARFVFLTATPFRRDKKAIPGRLAYSYPAVKAARENAFGRVKFRPARVKNDHDESAIDRAIAVATSKQLKADKKAGFDHRVFVRAASIKSTKGLCDLYKSLGVKVEAIHSHMSKKAQDHIEDALIEGVLDGVVCVDMYGEGYDFPKFKIAAVHAPHRSLVPTIQFIGRFARTNDLSTGEATFIAPLQRTRDAISVLFQEGVDIAQLIDDAAQREITGYTDDQEILEILSETRLHFSDYEAVSPLVLELYAHAQIFECMSKPDFDNIGENVGRKLQVVKQWVSKDGLISLLLTLDNQPPSWATSDVLVNVRHDAFLIAYNEASKCCYIGSTRRTNRLYLELMNSVCPDAHRPVSFETTRRAIAGLDNLKYYNVGLKNTSVNTHAESYRTLVGPSADRVVTAGDSRTHVQGHYFGSGSKGDDRETVGASSSSKVWSNQRLTVAEYIDWTSKINRRLFGEGEIAASRLDIIQHATTLKRIPASILVGDWHKSVYRFAPRVRYRLKGAAQWSFQQITDFEFSEFIVSDKGLNFNLQMEDVSIDLFQSIGGGQLIVFASNAWECEIQQGIDDYIDLATWLSEKPPVFYGADKSSFQGVNLMPAPKLKLTAVPDELVTAIDWTGCAIKVEFEKAKAGGLRTVQEHLCDIIKENENLKVLFYDHRSGEAADYIAIESRGDDSFLVALYHCKGAGGAPSGGRVGDVYEVAGQMLKSVSYCDVDTLARHMEHRANTDRHKVPSTFLVGDQKIAEKILLESQSVNIEFAIYGVQPGVSKAAIDHHLSDLMVYAIDYVQNGSAQAGWITSA